MAQVSQSQSATVSQAAGRILAAWGIGAFAAVSLVVIVFATVLLWPIPNLGFAYDMDTYTVEHVVPGSAADRAGLQIGDRVRSLYGHPIHEVIQSMAVVSWIPPRDQAIPIVVERAGQTLSLALAQDAPSPAFQAYKLAVAFLALVCWLTGYLLGVVRRHTIAGARVVACFWLGLGGVIGCLPLAQYTAAPLLNALVWLIITVFVPLGIAIHCWFPPRPESTTGVAQTWGWLAGGILALNSGLGAGVYLLGLSLLRLQELLFVLLPFAVIIGLGGSSWILYQAYRRTGVAHTRRQIRLIAVACLGVAVFWFLLRVVPLTFGFTITGDLWLTLASAAIPLAYLIGGLGADLYRLDRVAIRLLVHLATVTGLVTFLALSASLLHLGAVQAALWGAVCFVVVYRPVQHGIMRLMPRGTGLSRDYSALEQALTGLTHTLDAAALVTTLCNGLRAQFGQPALGCYLADINETSTLTLQMQERMEALPQTLPPGALSEALRRLPPINESRSVHRQLREAGLMAEEQQILTYQQIVLWCTIHHSEGHLLGLLLLGMRGDLDPYRDEDIQNVQRLIAAAALAFTNSAAYARQHEAERLIRQLYQQLQIAQDTAAAELARELHDDIINVHVRLNIRSLSKVVAQVDDADLRDELALVLTSEHTVIDALRRICERLHPTGLDDPLGLPAVLRLHVQHVQGQWHGRCQLDVTGPLQPVAPAVQRAALRITQEALRNALDHADATAILVHLQYPASIHGRATLKISDNGCSGRAIEPRAGHWGVRFMQERARAVGGTLHVPRNVVDGHTVIFTFPVGVTESDERAQEQEDYATAQVAR